MVAEEDCRSCNDITAAKLELFDYATSQAIANEISKLTSLPRGGEGGPLQCHYEDAAERMSDR